MALSKSNFIRSLQCPKALYLYKNYFKEREVPSKELQQRFLQGIFFGKMVWKLFDKGIDMSPNKPTERVIKQYAFKTAELLQKNTIALFEASFFVQEMLAIVDVVEKKEGRLFAYEVKSSTKITNTYLFDAAYQYYVMKKAGFCPEKMFLIHLKETAVLSEKNTVEDVETTDITTKVQDLLPEIEAKTILAKAACYDRNVLKIQQGEHCFHPYRCDFIQFCLKKTEETTPLIDY